MEYKTNIHYPLSEISNIVAWWREHKGYDINRHADYIEVVERADHGAPTIIAEAKSYLLETDYVITKISEAMVEGDDSLVAELKEHYAEVLSKRAEARAKVRELEQYL